MAKKKNQAKVPRSLWANPTVGLQDGTERTVYATWGATIWDGQSGYKVVWSYYTGQKDKWGLPIWFAGSDSTTSGLSSTYTAPANAKAVKVEVGPNPGSDKGWYCYLMDAMYDKGWKSSGGGGGGGEVKNTTPSAPSSVEIEINGTVVTAKVPNYKDANCKGSIRFQIIREDEKVVLEATASLTLGMAQCVYTLAELGGFRYKARAQAIGAHGTDSEWSSNTANKYTAPGQTKINRLVTVSKNSVDVHWDALRGAENYTIEYTSEVGADGQPVFDTGSSAVQSATSSTTHYVASSLDYKRWYFRVRGNGRSGAGSGAWSGIVNRQLGTKPDKPSVWSYTTVGKIGIPIVLNWVHSSEDGSAQTGAKIGIKINDNAETVIDLTTQTSYTYDTSSLSDSDKIKWRVRTRGTRGIVNQSGQSIEWGDYSEYREIVVYSPPSVEFAVGYPDPVESYPVIYKFPLSIEGLASPNTQTPVAFYVSVLSNEQYDISREDGTEVHVGAGEEIFTRYIPASSHELNLELSPGEIYLNQGTVYTVVVTVAMSNGLTAEASQMFMAKWEDTDWFPMGDVMVDSGLCVAYVRPFCADKWGFEYRKGFTLGVYRVDFDGNLTKIETGIDPAGNLTITDLHPSLDFARYRITATDNNTGEVSYADLTPIPVNSKAAVIQWEGETKSFFIDPLDVGNLINNWSGTLLRLPYNVDVSDDISPDVSLVEYIGRNHPVSYYGTQQGSTSRWTCEIPKSDTATIGKVRALAIYPGDVYVREPSGTGYWANVKVTTSINHNKPTVTATFAITRVEGGA